MRKIVLIFVLVNIIFSSSTFSFYIPDGSGGSYYGDIYKNPEYNYLNKDLNEIINSVLEGVATVTPPEEGVPVFPYDPVLYYLLIRGFGLDASMQQRVMQYLNKSFLETKKNELYKELGGRYESYEHISFLKAYHNTINLKDINNKDLARLYLGPAGWKKNVVDVCNNLTKFIKCRDIDFDQTISGFIKDVSGLFQLGTYCGIKYEEIPFCENQSPQFLVFSPRGNNLIASFFKALTGKIIVAQIGNENNKENQELPPAIKIYDRGDYIKRDLENSERIRTLSQFLGENSLRPPFPLRLGEYKRILQCIRDDDGHVYPYSTEQSKINISFSNQTPSQELKIAYIENTNNLDFSLSAKRLFFNGIDVFDFENSSDLFNYIYNQCVSKKVRTTDDNPLRSSAFSDCMISYLRFFVDSNNRAVKMFKDLKERIEGFYINNIWENVYNNVASPQVPLPGALKEKMFFLINVYKQKGEAVNELEIIPMPTNFSGCLRFSTCNRYMDTLRRLTENFRKLKLIIAGPGISLASDHPYSETAVLHYTLTYFQLAHDIKTNCLDNQENIINKNVYGASYKKNQYAKIKKIKVVRKIETKKSFENFFEALANFTFGIFKPKEFTIKIEK